MCCKCWVKVEGLIKNGHVRCCGVTPCRHVGQCTQCLAPLRGPVLTCRKERAWNAAMSASTALSYPSSLLQGMTSPTNSLLKNLPSDADTSSDPDCLQMAVPQPCMRPWVQSPRYSLGLNSSARRHKDGHNGLHKHGSYNRCM